MQAIWKDYSVNLGTGDSAAYTIRQGGNIIYSGTAYKRPDASSISIIINDVCADYMSNVRTAAPGTGTINAPNLVKTFTVHNAAGTQLDSVQFIFDWSFDTVRSSWDSLNEPVITKIDTRDILIMSSGTARTVHFGNESISVTQPCHIQRYVASLAGQNVNADGIVYQVRETNARYSLMYANLYGGYDVLLFEGKCTESEDLTNTTVDVAKSPNSTPRIENYPNRYVREVRRRRKWTLTTGWLTDSQAARMRHLFTSNSIILHDFEGRSDNGLGSYFNVGIIDTSYEIKTFKNQGCRMKCYTVNVEQSFEEVRR